MLSTTPLLLVTVSQHSYRRGLLYANSSNVGENLTSQELFYSISPASQLQNCPCFHPEEDVLNVLMLSW